MPACTRALVTTSLTASLGVVEEIGGAVLLCEELAHQRPRARAALAALAGSDSSSSTGLSATMPPGSVRRDYAVRAPRGGRPGCCLGSPDGHPQPDPGRGRGARRAARRSSATTSTSTSPTCPTGPAGPVRVDGHVHLPRARADTFVDCAAEVVSATLNGDAAAAGRRGPDRADRTSPSDNALRRGDRAGRHHRRARACTRPSTPPTARSTCGPRSSPTRRATSGPASTSPTSRRRTRSRSPRRPPGRCVSNSGDPVVEDVGDGAARGRSRDTPPLSTYNPVVIAGPFHEIRREARRLRPRPASPAGRSRSVLDRDADELFTLTAQGLAFFGERVRDAVPAAQVRPGLPARVRRRDGELRLRHLVATSFLRRTTPTPAEREQLRQGAAARDGAHVVRQHRHDALVGRPVAQRGVRRVRLHTGRRSGATAYTDAWASHLAGEQAAGLPRRPGADLAPDPPADPRRRAGRRRSSTPSPTPRARRCCSS